MKSIQLNDSDWQLLIGMLTVMKLAAEDNKFDRFEKLLFSVQDAEDVEVPKVEESEKECNMGNGRCWTCKHWDCWLKNSAGLCKVNHVLAPFRDKFVFENNYCSHWEEFQGKRT